MAPIGLTPKAAAAAIPCGITKLYELINAGELDTYTIGRGRRITTASIKAYVARQLQSREA